MASSYGAKGDGCNPAMRKRAMKPSKNGGVKPPMPKKGNPALKRFGR